jgi:hypothetical protein
MSLRTPGVLPRVKQSHGRKERSPRPAKDAGLQRDSHVTASVLCEAISGKVQRLPRRAQNALLATTHQSCLLVKEYCHESMELFAKTYPYVTPTLSEGCSPQQAGSPARRGTPVLCSERCQGCEPSFFGDAGISLSAQSEADRPYSAGSARWCADAASRKPARSCRSRTSRSPSGWRRPCWSCFVR